MLKSHQPRRREERQQFIQEQMTAREASQEIDRLDEAAILLEPAIRAARRAGFDVATLSAMLQSFRDRRESALSRGGGRTLPRNRPEVQRTWNTEGPRNLAHLFIDESGGSRLNLLPQSDFFAVGGLLLTEDAITDFESRWLEWKRIWVGRENATMHARNLRRQHMPYYVKKGLSLEDAVASLESLIDDTDCQLFVTVIDKVGFQREFDTGKVDGFLPGTHYDMCLNFLLERVTHCLLHNGDCFAHVFAESRNRLEDAKLQMEYQRLQIEGTLFHADTWFRYQLGPHITYREKRDNIAGLQLVDILLRAVVDKLTAPDETPRWWEVAKRKLYDKDGSRIDGWGLKVFPHDANLVAKVLELSAK